MELQVKKAKANGVRTKQVGFERPCDKMTEAMVMDGGKRGQIGSREPVAIQFCGFTVFLQSAVLRVWLKAKFLFGSFGREAHKFRAGVE